MTNHLFTFNTRAFFETDKGEKLPFEWISIPSDCVEERDDHFEIVDDDGEMAAIFYKHAITSVVFLDD